MTVADVTLHDFLTRTCDPGVLVFGPLSDVFLRCFWRVPWREVDFNVVVYSFLQQDQVGSHVKVSTEIRVFFDTSGYYFGIDYGTSFNVSKEN